MQCIFKHLNYMKFLYQRRLHLFKNNNKKINKKNCFFSETNGPRCCPCERQTSSNNDIICQGETNHLLDLDLGVNDSAVVVSTERLEEFKKSVVLKTGHQMYSASIFHRRMSY